MAEERQQMAFRVDSRSVEGGRALFIALQRENVGSGRHRGISRQCNSLVASGTDIGDRAPLTDSDANDPGCVKTRHRCYDSLLILGGI